MIYIVAIVVVFLEISCLAFSGLLLSWGYLSFFSSKRPFWVRWKDIFLRSAKFTIISFFLGSLISCFLSKESIPGFGFFVSLLFPAAGSVIAFRYELNYDSFRSFPFARIIATIPGICFVGIQLLMVNLTLFSPH